MRVSVCLLRSVTRDVFQSVKCPVLAPGQPEYSKAIATSNRLFRFSTPDYVVQPERPSDVQDIIKEAAAKKLDITIKGNGHSYAGHSTASKGISLDLRRMRNVKLDIDSKTVTMDAGCQWGHIYQTLVNGGHNRYMINGGRCPTVGVSGFILGGGLGPFTRSLGMACDSLVEATVVTANGDLVKVSENDSRDSDNGKLFWALKGAGGGNFGVLVEMKLKVHELKQMSGTVVAGRHQWFPKEGLSDDVLLVMNDFYMAQWPENITIDSTWICDLRRSGADDGIRFTMSFDGSKIAYERTIDNCMKHERLGTQLKRKALPEPSTRFLHETLVNQWLEETERAYPENKSYELYSSFVFKNDNRQTIEKVTRVIRDLMKEFRRDFAGEGVNFLVTWIHSGGQATRTKPGDTAFFWRDAVFHTYVTIEWMDKWMERDMRRFLAKVKNALRPLSLNGEAAFVNFPDRDFPTKSHEKAYFGDNRDELRRVKQIWDKNKFFKFPQGVRLPGDPEEDGDEVDGEGMTDQLAKEQWRSYIKDDFGKSLEYLSNLGY